MSIRTFWILLLRILGLFLVLQSFSVITQFLPSFSLFFDNPEPNVSAIVTLFALMFIVIGGYFYVMRLIIFKSDWIIDKFKLDHGFDDDKLDFNIQSNALLSIATIVIGGVMMADAIPFLCREIVVFYQQKVSFQDSLISSWIILFFIKASVGYYLITNSKMVIDFIQNMNRKVDENAKVDNDN